MKLTVLFIAPLALVLATPTPEDIAARAIGSPCANSSVGAPLLAFPAFSFGEMTNIFIRAVKVGPEPVNTRPIVRPDGLKQVTVPARLTFNVVHTSLARVA